MEREIKEKVFCCDCKYCLHLFRKCTKYTMQRYDYFEKYTVLADCSVLNKNNDCKGFEAIKEDKINEKYEPAYQFRNLLRNCKIFIKTIIKKIVKRK